MTRQNAIQTQQQASSASPLSKGGILQRKCESCGQHTIAGGECTDCGKKKIGLQRKLTIGASNDPLELEADRVADRVMSASPNSVVNSAPPRIQRFTGPTTGQVDMVAPASVDNVLLSPGSPLKTGLQQDMGQRFGHDFSRVRVHTGDEAARSAQDVNAKAYTAEHNIVFDTGRFTPETQEGRRLIAHELTHTLQQNKSSPTQIIQRAGMGDVHLAEARHDEEERQKKAFFDRLRSLSPSNDPGLRSEMESQFPPNTDDRWLAETILKNGPEPRWSLTDITERQKRAMNNDWAPGNIKAVLGTGGHTVEAFYFRGTTDRRALIIGGVHGSEPGGVEVVNNLLTIMRSPNAPMPFFSVIIVPKLFAANVDAPSRKVEDRRTSGGRVKSSSSEAKKGSEASPDPNRQFPAVGVDPGSNAALGCVVDDEQRCIEPENLILLDLVNRFQPERVATAHGHSTPHATEAKPATSKQPAIPARTAKENLLLEGGPSITTDPRPGKEAEDDKLALSMATEAEKLGVRIPGNFMGKPEQTTRYPTGTAPAMSKGITFGKWGSNPTPTRPAMNIILIETFGNTTSTNDAKQASRKTELMNLAQILRDFFLTSP